MRQSAKDALANTALQLERHSSGLVEDLAKIVRGDWGLYENVPPNSVAFLDFEVFVDGYRVALYPTDDSNTQLGYRRIMPIYEDGILSASEFSPDLSLYDFNNDADNQELSRFDSEQQALFLQWFASCWSRVDVTALDKPAYLMIHDSDRKFDLLSKRWV